MKIKSITKHLTKILFATIICLSMVFPARSINSLTTDQAVIQQIKVDNDLSKSVTNQIYDLLNSPNITKDLTKSELFSAKSSLGDLKSTLENLSISEMAPAQEIFNKLNVLRNYMANKSSPPNVAELIQNMNKITQYIKNIPKPRPILSDLRANAEKLLLNIKDPKIHHEVFAKWQELSNFMEKIPPAELCSKTAVVGKIFDLNGLFGNLLPANSQVPVSYDLSKLPQKIDELINIIKKIQNANGETGQKMLPRQNNKNMNETQKIVHMQPIFAPNNKNEKKQRLSKPFSALSRSQKKPNIYKIFNKRSTNSSTKQPSNTILESRIKEAAKIFIRTSDDLLQTWKESIQAGVQGRNDCWLFSAINVQNWFNYKNKQKIFRGQSEIYKEFLNKGEPKHLLGSSQNQLIITKYLQKCGFSSYIILSGLQQNDKESLNFNKSLAEVLVKNHFAKSQTPIIVHKSNHWIVIAGIDTYSDKALIVDSALSAPVWMDLYNFYDSIAGVTCSFKFKTCYALGMIFVTDEKKAENPKAISILQSKINSQNTRDIFSVNQFLIDAIDAASK